MIRAKRCKIDSQAISQTSCNKNHMHIAAPWKNEKRHATAHGTTGQRDNGTPGQRDNGTTGHRANGTTGHRANGTPGQRANGTPGNGQANRESQRDNDQEQEKLQGKHAWDQQARQPSNKTRRRMARERGRACYSVVSSIKNIVVSKMRMTSRKEIEMPCQILSRSRQR